MRVWLIQIGESFPVNCENRRMRTAMIAEKLVARGHQVTWWGSAFDHLHKQWVFSEDTESELAEGFKIIAIKGIGYKKNISLRRVIDNRIISHKFKMMAPRLPKPDIIVAAMPSYDLAYNAVKFAKLNSIPIIVDIRDQWPDSFLDAIPSFFRPIARMILHRDFMMVQETMKSADAIFSMMNTLLEWGLQYAQRGKGKFDMVYYLGYNKIPVDSGILSKVGSLELDKLQASFVVTFIGTFGFSHNPEILVDVARRLQREGIVFVLAGNGEFFDKIKDNAKGLENIFFPGWLNPEEIVSLLAKSHIGVCTSTRGAYFFPNKSFLYFAAGLPVVSAFYGDLKSIIETHEIGYFYPPNDIEALVTCIRKLSDKNRCEKFSKNVRVVFDAMFDSDVIYNDYASKIENIQLSNEKFCEVT